MFYSLALGSALDATYEIADLSVPDIILHVPLRTKLPDVAASMAGSVPVAACAHPYLCAAISGCTSLNINIEAPDRPHGHGNARLAYGGGGGAAGVTLRGP